MTARAITTTMATEMEDKYDPGFIVGSLVLPLQAFVGERW
jgi:hypothetical protein